MKPNKLTDYLPTREDTRPVMANVSAVLVEKAKRLMKQDGIGWRELIEAAIQKYVEESK